MEWEVCPTLLHMTSSGNRTPDLLILSPTPYQLGHMLIFMYIFTELYHKNCSLFIRILCSSLTHNVRKKKETSIMVGLQHAKQHEQQMYVTIHVYLLHTFKSPLLVTDTKWRSIAPYTLAIGTWYNRYCVAISRMLLPRSRRMVVNILVYQFHEVNVSW